MIIYSKDERCIAINTMKKAKREEIYNHFKSS